MAWLCRKGLILRSSSDLHRWNVDGEGCLASGVRATGENCRFFGWMVLGGGSSQRAGFLEKVSPPRGLCLCRVVVDEVVGEWGTRWLN